MNRATFLGIGTGVLMSLSAFGAQAMPMAGDVGVGSPLVEHVADGCGPGGFRGPRGYCRPFRGGGYDRPRFYGPRFYDDGPRYRRRYRDYR